MIRGGEAFSSRRPHVRAKRVCGKRGGVGTMAVLVQKYGGSSVADIQKIGVVADRVVAAKRAGNDVVVVVSAMGKTTDELLSLAKRVALDPPRRELDMLVSTGERVTM